MESVVLLLSLSMGEADSKIGRHPVARQAKGYNMIKERADQLLDQLDYGLHVAELAVGSWWRHC